MTRLTSLFVLATSIVMSGTSSAQSLASWLTVEAVDTECRPLDGITMVISKRSGAPSGRPIQKINAGRDGRVVFEREPEGIFDVLAGSPGYIGTKVGPLNLNDQSHLTIRLMVAPDPSPEAAELRALAARNRELYRPSP